MDNLLLANVFALHFRRGHQYVPLYLERQRMATRPTLVLSQYHIEGGGILPDTRKSGWL